MRKVLSLILVAVMLVCGMAIAPAGASAAILSSGNVTADIYYFDGNVEVKDTFGRVGSIIYGEAYSIKDDGDPTKTIVLDGVIEEGEWGDPVVVVDSKYAASNISATGGLIETYANSLYETPSAENTYFYRRRSGQGFDGVSAGALGYTLYMMWDETYFYVAAYVEDPDGHTTPLGGEKLWDGDCLQFRLDSHGANSILEETGDEYYDASKIAVEVFDASGKLTATYNTFPWRGAERKAQESHSTVPNFMFGYTDASLNGGETDAYDAALRYDPEIHYVIDQEGNDTDVSYTIWHGQELFGLIDGSYWEDNPAYGVVYPKNYGTQRDPDWKTGYEIAIPWEMLDEDEEFLGSIGEGTEIGATFALLNAMKGKGTYNSWLEWGSGVCGSRTENDPQTCGGSNLLTLKNTPYTTARCEHEFEAATCLKAETCKYCGYQRGYASGHDFVFSDAKPCTTTEAGTITATCTVEGCGHTYTTEITPQEDASVARGFTTTDTTIANHGFGSGFICAWYSSDDTDTDAQGNSYRTGTMLFNPDGSSKCSYDTEKFGYAVADCATRGSDSLVDINGNPVTYEDDPNFNYQDQTGTYFDMDTISTNKYAFKADLYIPYFPTERPQSDYTSGLYNWFGGANIYKYMAGLFSFPGYEDKIFAIGETDLICYCTTPEQLKEGALVYKDVTGTKLIETETWHEMVFMYDDQSFTAFLYWDNQLQVAAQDYHFQLVGHSTATPLFRRMDVPFYAKNMYITTMSYATENFLDLSGGHKLTIDGVTTDVVTGQTVELDKKFYVEDDLGYRFDTWTGDTYVLEDATLGVTSFTMPDADVELTSSYFIVGDINKDKSITSIDSNMLAKIIAGAGEEARSADLNNDGSITSIDANLMISMILNTFTPDK